MKKIQVSAILCCIILGCFSTSCATSNFTKFNLDESPFSYASIVNDQLFVFYHGKQKVVATLNKEEVRGAGLHYFNGTEFWATLGNSVQLWSLKKNKPLKRIETGKFVNILPISATGDCLVFDDGWMLRYERSSDTLTLLVDLNRTFASSSLGLLQKFEEPIELRHGQAQAVFVPEGRMAFDSSASAFYFSVNDRLFRYGLNSGTVSQIGTGTQPLLVTNEEGHQYLFYQEHDTLLRFDLADGDVKPVSLAGVEHSVSGFRLLQFDMPAPDMVFLSVLGEPTVFGARYEKTLLVSGAKVYEVTEPAYELLLKSTPDWVVHGIGHSFSELDPSSFD